MWQPQLSRILPGMRKAVKRTGGICAKENILDCLRDHSNFEQDSHKFGEIVFKFTKDYK
jgi:hypothetical protein